jgi:hypothetical protein
MYKEFKITWKDLTEKTQKDLIENGFIYDNNMDEFPIAIISQEIIDEEYIKLTT